MIRDHMPNWGMMKWNVTRVVSQVYVRFIWYLLIWKKNITSKNIWDGEMEMELKIRTKGFFREFYVVQFCFIINRNLQYPMLEMCETRACIYRCLHPEMYACDICAWSLSSFLKTCYYCTTVICILYSIPFVRTQLYMDVHLIHFH